VLDYVGAQVEPDACARLPVSRDDIGPDGLVTNVEFRTGALDALTTLTQPPPISAMGGGMAPET
jgi:hypothetical protein